MRQARTTPPALLSRMSSGAWISAIPTAPAPPAGSAEPTRVATARVAAARGATVAGNRLGQVAGIFGDAEPIATLKSITDPTGLAAAAATLLTNLSAPLRAGAVYRAINVPALQHSLASSIDPAQAIDHQVNARTNRTDGRTGAAPFVVAPTFPQPMSTWLESISKAWLLPGLDKVPQNTVALLAANRRFIEAFMAGLNHELGRRLVFDEYPTDLTATYFQYFWGPVSADIAAIDTWTALGSNPAPGSPALDPLVLVLRGPLVERYRNMVVSAVAGSGTGAQPTLGAVETFPIFSGRMDPDVAFFGFPITVPQAMGSTTIPGYYFMIAEHPSEPRFGGTAPSPPGSSATLAAALLHHPVRLVVYAPDLLKATGGA